MTDLRCPECRAGAHGSCAAERLIVHVERGLRDPAALAGLGPSGRCRCDCACDPLARATTLNVKARVVADGGRGDCPSNANRSARPLATARAVSGCLS